MCSAGAEENPPDLTGFKVDRTYIVTYGEDGKEYTKQSISDILEDGYTVDSNNALVKGEIDFSKIDTTNGEWYDYSKQKWANIVTRNNGVESYYVWIPRYAYALNNNETTNIIFINTSDVNRRTGKKPDLAKYTIPEAFEWNGTPIAGYWIGKYQINDGTAVNINATITTGVNSITLLLPDTSTFGENLHYDIALKQAGKEIYRIDNTKDTSFEFSEDTIETYLFGGTYEITIAIFDEQGYYIADTVKTCTLQGAKITAHIFEGANKIRITEIANNALTSDYKYDVILSKGGAEVNKIEGLTLNECEFTKDSTGNRLEAGDYTIQIILKNTNGDYRGETSINAVCYSQPEIDSKPNAPDITGFRTDTTYIVTYDDAGNEDTSQTLASVLGEDGQVDLSKVQGVWYDYANQKWANVVTRNNGVEAYFVWIPRYEYHAYSDEQITDVYFIGTEQVTATNGYIIPEAFTWNDTQISGYWIGKYQINDDEPVNIDTTITTGVNNITLSVSNAVLTGDNAHYDITLRKAGVQIYRIKDTSSTSFEFSENATGTYLLPGTYEISIKLYNSQNQYIGETVKTCTLQPFSLTAHVFEGANKIRITKIANNALTSNYKYDVILSKGGAEVNKIEGLTLNECEITKDNLGNRLEAGDYTIQIILKNTNGEYRGETSINAVCYSQPEIDSKPNAPDITGFRTDTTYIVTYDDAGNEDTSQTLASVLGEDGQVDLSKVQGVWYDYANQKWANVVTRNNGVEAYFVWIPRYEYHAYSYEQITDVYFIGTEQVTATNGYIIPEAFNWNGTQISGYWIGKYQISDN